MRIPPGTGWRVVPSPDLPCSHWHGGESSASIDGVAALGPSDVWTAGSCVVGETTAGVISHWDGRRWSSLRLPRGARSTPVAASPGAGGNVIAGTADDDMWAVGGGSSNSPPQNGNIAFHWDGGQWTDQSQGLPGGGGFDAIAASAAAGTWAIVKLRGSPYGTALLRWDGHRWQQLPFPPLFDTNFPPDHLAAGPGNSVWIGGDSGGAGYGVPLAARYDGHGWSYYRLPRTTSEGGRVIGFAVAGLSAWALVDNLAPPPGGYQALVSLTGGTAGQLKIPGDHLLQISAMAGDPRSGLYLLRAHGTVTGGIVVQHWDGRGWHVEPVPVPSHSYVYRGSDCVPSGSAYGKPGGRLNGLEVSAIASVPGTATVWAAGSFGGGGAALYPDCPQPTTQPVVEVDGPVPQH